MYLRKVEKDGTTLFVPIKEQEVKKCQENGEEVIYVPEASSSPKEEDEEIRMEDENDYSSEEDEEDEDEKKEKSSWTFNSKKRKSDFETNIRDMVESAISSVSSMFGDISSTTNNKKSKKSSTISKILPFLSEEDLHEVALKIKSGDEDYKDIDISILLPFLSEEDCDELLLDSLKKESNPILFKKALPFVSSKCLGEIVDGYIEGEYPKLNVDVLYPFLDSKDVKKLLNYMIKQK